MIKKISVFFLVLSCLSCKKPTSNTRLSGAIFGTSYSIIYDGERNYQIQIDSLFDNFNGSLSTYIETSFISKINRNEDSIVDHYFSNVFNTSKAIYNATQGAFDPTIGVVVNAWDFGPEGNIEELDSLKIDSLMQFVGLHKLTMNGDILDKPKGTFLDFNAIAKGYGVDVIGTFLESENIQNYLVEIGGEIRVRGRNLEKNAPWKVGIEAPHFDSTKSVLKAISLQDKAMATSGTYRKFKIDANGKRYSHIINPKTGYPSKTNLLSISVIADNCMKADAYATAFKAMGIEKVKTFLNSHPEIQAFLIFENENKELETMALNGFPKE